MAMFETESIKRYLKTYSNEALAALEAHAEDGKLSFHSCCCLVGARNADHPLQTAGQFGNHYHKLGRSDELKLTAELEFLRLGDGDAERRDRVLPLIRAEAERRGRKIPPQARERVDNVLQYQ